MTDVYADTEYSVTMLAVLAEHRGFVIRKMPLRYGTRGLKMKLRMLRTVKCAKLADIMTAKLIGAVLPLIAKKCKLDPAVMASPLVTTILDAVSLFIYFAFAGAIIGI